MVFKLTLLPGVLLAVTAAVSAQQGEWQQCGGIGWSGATTCITGTECTVLNDYYYQCLPATTSSPIGTTHTPTSPTTISPPPTTVSSPASSPTSTGTPNFWFSFGDSYTQTGFLDNDTLPAPGNPLGNPPYPGYTAVGGTNWIDVDTVVYNKSLILTYNYAYGGATINASLVEPYEPTVLSLVDQVNEFLGTVAGRPVSTPWTSADSLFSFWIGINDIGNSWYESGNRSAFAEELLDSYFGLVDDVYNVGARNFLFINVPPVDRSPLMAAQGAASQAGEAAVIEDFNARLLSRVEELNSTHTDVTTYFWDSNTAFSIVLDDPQAYGFVDNTSYGNPGDFWGNNYHSSSAAQTIWGQDVAAVLADSIW